MSLSPNALLSLTRIPSYHALSLRRLQSLRIPQPLAPYRSVLVVEDLITLSVCRFTASPYFNSSDSAYADSNAFKKLKKDNPDASVARGAYVPTTSSSSSSSTATTSASAVPEGPSQSVTKQKSLKKTSKLSSTTSFTDVVISSSILGAPTNPSSADFLTATVSYVSQPSQPRNEVQVLIETGSLTGNFVAMRVVKNFFIEEFLIFDKTLTVCSAF